MKTKELKKPLRLVNESKKSQNLKNTQLDKKICGCGCSN